MNYSDLKLTAKSIEDIVRCANLASLLEVSGWPKPGNVHRTKNFKNTQYEHFLAGIAAIQPNIREFCENVNNNINSIEENFSIVRLGEFYVNAVKSMMRWQNGGNVILGHILLLGPLCATSAICLKFSIHTFKNFRKILQKVIKEATVEDTIQLYEAINYCNPGGMGKIDKYDLNDPNFEKDIREDNITLRKIFKLSRNYDLISSEYDSSFSTILDDGLPQFIKYFNKEKEINKTVVNIFLYLLSRYPDSLIIRKSGKEEANRISKRAHKIIQKGGTFSKSGLELTYLLDDELQKEGGKLNPGTTADLTAGIIFCALLFGLKL